MTGIRAREQGVALAIVVWFVAGMSLLVAGIVSHARVDTGMTQVHLGRAKAVAAGDGAIQLAMVAQYGRPDARRAGETASESVYRVGDIDVRVRLHSATGFIDLNSAPAELLATLFVFAGQVPAGEANLIADNVVKWRKSPAAGGGQRVFKRRRFYAPEDMLRVEGVTRQLLDSIRDYSVAGDWAQGVMEWGAAPEASMEMMKKLKPGQVDSVLRRRDNLVRNQQGIARVERDSGGGVYRADALISYGGRTWLRRRWLESRSGNTGSKLPWRVVRTEPPRVVGG